MNKINLTLPYPPSANRYWVTFAYLSKNPRNFGKPMANTVPSTEAKEYKMIVREHCVKNKVRRLRGDLEFRIKLFRPKRIGDLDNRLKVLIDSLRELAYEDDDQITRIVAERYDDKFSPRVEVEIHVLKPDAEQEQLSFVANNGQILRTSPPVSAGEGRTSF